MQILPRANKSLSPQDLVNIEVEIGEKVNAGTYLVNVQFGRLGNE